MYYELTAVTPEKGYQRRVFHQAKPRFSEYVVWLPSQDDPAARRLAGYQFSTRGLVWRRVPGEIKGALFQTLTDGAPVLRSRPTPIDPVEICAVGRHLSIQGILQLLDREMIEAVIDACAHVAISRLGPLRELKQKLTWNNPDRTLTRLVEERAVTA